MSIASDHHENSKLERRELEAEINDLSREQLLVLYARLSFQLTITVRGIWSDDTLSDADKVNQMKWVNELQHRITQNLQACLWRDSSPLEPAVFIKTIVHWEALCPELTSQVWGWIARSCRVVASK
jgi:hypothetical protein